MKLRGQRRRPPVGSGRTTGESPQPAVDWGKAMGLVGAVAEAGISGGGSLIALAVSAGRPPLGRAGHGGRGQVRAGQSLSGDRRVPASTGSD